MTDVVARLSALLEAERQALRKGDIATLTELTPQKTTLADDLSQLAALSQAQRDEMQVLLDRNRRLLAAARDGVRDVQARLQEQQRLRQGMTTYDRSGQENRIGAARPGTERRF
jgi:flagellar biosynthesis/type III secretory pathway chaperone